MLGYGWRAMWMKLLFFTVASLLSWSNCYAQSARPPISIAIVIDVSKSVSSRDSKKRTKVLLESLAQFVQSSNQQNEYFIIGVSTQPHLLLGGVSDVDSTLSALSNIDSFRHGGATALYDACILGFDKVTHGRYSRKAVLILSDGMDTYSEKSLDDLLELLKGSNVPFYSVNTGFPKSTTDRSYKPGIIALDRMASVSGGSAFHLRKPEELKTAFDSIIRKLQF